jgi:GNAT superfamily N-acetyltransferase
VNHHTDVPASLRLLATEMWFVIPPPPRANRVVSDQYVLHLPDNRLVPFTSAGRLRLDPADPGRMIEEIRRFFVEQDRSWVTWWVSPETTPAGLAERLRDDGAIPLEDPQADPLLAAMVLRAEPDPAGLSDAIVARAVSSADEFALSSELYWEAEGIPEAERARFRPKLAENYEARHLSGQSTTFLAWLNDEPVAMASASFRPEGAALNGAVTLPRFRGQGAYRALVHARWQEARRRGLPGLATQARLMSKPILARLGFVSLGEIELLYDRL